MSATYNQFGQTSSPSPRSLSMEHTCRVLGISRRTLYYWIGNGRLQTVRTRMGSQRVLTESVRAAFVQKLQSSADTTACSVPCLWI